jgi:hypothetical protein
MRRPQRNRGGALPLPHSPTAQELLVGPVRSPGRTDDIAAEVVATILAPASWLAEDPRPAVVAAVIAPVSAVIAPVFPPIVSVSHNCSCPDDGGRSRDRSPQHSASSHPSSGEWHLHTFRVGADSGE